MVLVQQKLSHIKEITMKKSSNVKALSVKDENIKRAEPFGLNLRDIDLQEVLSWS